MIDDVIISEQAEKAWIAHMLEVAKSGVLKGLKEKDIPDEDTRLNKDGDLEIFIEIPNRVEISMKVPKEHWKFKHQG